MSERANHAVAIVRSISPVDFVVMTMWKVLCRINHPPDVPNRALDGRTLFTVLAARGGATPRLQKFQAVITSQLIPRSANLRNHGTLSELVYL